MNDLKVDTKVLVSNYIFDKNEIRYFSHFNEKGKICCFINGKKSTKENKTLEWEFWKLEEEL